MTQASEQRYTLREAAVIVNYDRCQTAGHRPTYDESPETRNVPRGTWAGAESIPTDWYCECGYIRYERAYPHGRQPYGAEQFEWFRPWVSP